MLSRQRGWGYLGWVFFATVLVVLVAGCLLVSSPATADSPGEGEVNVSVEPAQTDVEQGETVTYEIIVEGAESGIDAYAHLDIAIEEPTVAEFVNFRETAADNVDGSLTLSLTEIQDASGNKSETGPILSMEAALTGNASFDGAERIVIAEADVAVLGSVPSATGVTIVENPEPDEIDEPQIAKNSAGDAYSVQAFDDSELALPAAANVSLVPTETELLPGETTTYQVVVGAGYGLAGYDSLELVIEDPLSGQFVDFTETAFGNVGPGGEAPVSNSEIRDIDGNPAGAGSVLHLDADLNDGAFGPSEGVVVAEVETQATGLTTTPVSVANGSTLQDLEGLDYQIANTNASELAPVGIDVNGNGQPATDTSGDGLLNDIDGDSEFSIFDVQAFFNNFDRQVLQGNAQLFDFNQDGASEPTIFDVQSLFNRLADAS